MGKFIDLTGERFDRLMVLKRIEGLRSKRIIYLCKCDCGNEIEVRADSLRSRHTKSCGCLQREIVKENSTKHGHSDSRLYNIWASMIQRCYNQNHIGYSNYGGRGIDICEEWKEDFGTFYNWAINNGYKEDLQIDRVDNNLGYKQSNCRFVTAKQNNRNRRVTKLVEYKGETKPLADWCDELSKDYIVVLNRLNALGWTVEDALTR